MTTELRVIDPPTAEDVGEGPYWKDPKWWGVMWRMPEDDLPDRESWFLILPNGAGGWQTTELLWEVTGIPPKITVKPSIDAGEWHGWITDGVMTP